MLPCGHGKRSGLKIPTSINKGDGGGGGMEWEFGVSRCELSYIGWIHDKAPLESPGNCIQSPGIDHHGKEYEKEKIYTYIYTYIRA